MVLLHSELFEAWDGVRFVNLMPRAFSALPFKKASGQDSDREDPEHEVSFSFTRERNNSYMTRPQMMH